jgi:hypothetical protein
MKSRIDSKSFCRFAADCPSDEDLELRWKDALRLSRMRQCPINIQESSDYQSMPFADAAPEPLGAHFQALHCGAIERAQLASFGARETQRWVYHDGTFAEAKGLHGSSVALPPGTLACIRRAVTGPRTPSSRTCGRHSVTSP